MMYLKFLSTKASIGTEKHFNQNSSVSGPELLTTTQANITSSAIKSVKQTAERSQSRMDRQSDRQGDLACVPVCLWIPPINFWMAEPIFINLCMYIMAPEPISTAYFTNPLHVSLCLYVSVPVVARQGHGKNVTAAMNTQATIEKFLDASSSKGWETWQGCFSVILRVKHG
jgi:hypothetical protein